MILDHKGAVLSGIELETYARKHGLCRICARTQTHKRSGRLLKKIRNQWQPLTVMDEKGTGYLVYKGFCIQPTCYSLDQAMEILGESRRGVQRKHSTKTKKKMVDDTSDSTELASIDFSIDDSTMTTTTLPSLLERASHKVDVPEPPEKIRWIRNIGKEYSTSDFSSIMSDVSSRHLDVDDNNGGEFSNRYNTPGVLAQPRRLSTSSDIVMSPSPTSYQHTSLIVPPQMTRPGSHQYQQQQPLYPHQALRSSAPASTLQGLHKSTFASFGPRTDPSATTFLRQHLDRYLQTPTEKQLNVSTMEMFDANIISLLSTLRTKRLSMGGENPLEVLVADKCKLGQGHRLENMFQGLNMESRDVWKLSLRANEIEQDGGLVLARYMPRKLKDLNISKNPIGSEGANELLDAISRIPTIQKLGMARCQILDLDVRASQLLSSNRSLTLLNLENNFLRDKGIELISVSVRENDFSALKKLYLANNAFGDMGAIALSGMLEVNKCLRVLGVGENSIKSGGAKCLLKSLTTMNTTLREISGLYSNQIADRNIIQDIETHLEETLQKKLSESTNKIEPLSGHGIMHTELTLEGMDGPFAASSSTIGDMSRENSHHRPENSDDAKSSSEESKYVFTMDDGSSSLAHKSDPSATVVTVTVTVTPSDDSSDSSSRFDENSIDSATVDSDDDDDMIDFARNLESILPLPNLHLATSAAAGLTRRASYRGAIDALDLAASRLSSGMQLRTSHEELKTVCLNAMADDSNGFEAIAFTLQAHAEADNEDDDNDKDDDDTEAASIADVSRCTSDRVSVTDEAVEVELGDFTVYCDNGNGSDSVRGDDDDIMIVSERTSEVSFDASQGNSSMEIVSAASVGTRAALEAEINACKKTIAELEHVDDPDAKRLRIKERKRLVSLLPLRRQLPSRKQIELRLEELELSMEDAEDEEEQAELEMKMKLQLDLLEKEVNEEYRLLQDDTDPESKKLSNEGRVEKESSTYTRPHHGMTTKTTNTAAAAVARTVLPTQVQTAVDSRTDRTTTTSHPNDVLTLFQAAPLSYVDSTTKERHMLPLLDFDYEQRILKQSLKDAERIGAKIELELEIATTDRLSAFFAQGGRRVLHLSCHGHPDFLALENGFGDMQPLLVRDLKRFISAGGVALDFVFVSACHSKSAGMAFLEAGVPHVVCCRQDAMFRDEGAVEFARNFYRALACNKTLKQAFDMAREAVRVSPVIKDSELEYDKFLLLPERPDKDPYHEVNVFFSDQSHALRLRRRLTTEEQEQERRRQRHPPTRVLQRVPQNFVGREEDMYRILEALRCTDLVQVQGPKGSGKSTLVAAVTRYIQRRQKSFMFDDILWLPAPEENVDETIEEDGLYSSMTKVITMLMNSNGNTKHQRLYKEHWGKAVRKLQGIRCLFVIDARLCKFQLAWKNLEEFLGDLLQVSSVKLILIVDQLEIFQQQQQHRINHSTDTDHPHYDHNFHHHHTRSVPTRTIQIAPLDFEMTALLFSMLVQSARYSAPELAKILAPSSSKSKSSSSSSSLTTNNTKRHHQQQQKLPSRRQSIIYEKIGNGYPRDIERYATQMSEKDLKELIRLAKRRSPTEEQISTRYALERSIQNSLAEESRALRKKHYLRARDIRDVIEEMQSLRVHLPTVQDLQQQVTALQESLNTSVMTRKYDVANSIKEQMERIEDQISCELEEQRKEEALTERVEQLIGMKSTTNSAASAGAIVPSSRTSTMANNNSTTTSTAMVPSHGRRPVNTNNSMMNHHQQQQGELQLVPYYKNSSSAPPPDSSSSQYQQQQQYHNHHRQYQQKNQLHGRDSTTASNSNTSTNYYHSGNRYDNNNNSTTYNNNNRHQSNVITSFPNHHHRMMITSSSAAASSSATTTTTRTNPTTLTNSPYDMTNIYNNNDNRKGKAGHSGSTGRTTVTTTGSSSNHHHHHRRHNSSITTNQYHHHHHVQQQQQQSQQKNYPKHRMVFTNRTNKN